MPTRPRSCVRAPAPLVCPSYSPEGESVQGPTEAISSPRPLGAAASATDVRLPEISAGFVGNRSSLSYHARKRVAGPSMVHLSLTGRKYLIAATTRG